MTLQINTPTGSRALTADEQTEARTGLGAETAGAGAAAVVAHVAQADPHPGKYATADHTHALLMTQPERDKLTGVASGATANATDAALRDRSTHTGEQAQSTITGLVNTLAGKATAAQGAKADSALQPADAASFATAAQGVKADAALPGNADALADLLEAAPTTDPASLARIQSSVSEGGIYPHPSRPKGLVRGVRSFAGQFTHTAAFAAKTWRTNIELPCPAANLIAVRFAVASNPNGPVSFTAAVGSCATLAEVNAADGYQYAGFDGSDYNAFAAFVVAKKAQRYPDYVWSDWITVRPKARTDGGTWACVSISLYCPNTDVTIFGNATSDNAHNGGLAYPGLRYQTYFADGDYVTVNPMTMPSAGQPSSTLLAAVEFLADNAIPIVTWAHYSDSIAMGQLQTRKGLGPIVAAAQQINGEQSAFRVSPCISGYPGEPVQGSFRRMQQMFKQNAGLPTFAIFRPYSPNNAGQSWPGLTYMRTFVAECRARGVVPVFETGIYSSANTGYEAARAAVNSAVIAYGAANNIPVIDVGGLITAGNAATYLADGVHPNDAGQLLMMPEYKRVIYQESARAVVA